MTSIAISLLNCDFHCSRYWEIFGTPEEIFNNLDREEAKGSCDAEGRKVLTAKAPRKQESLLALLASWRLIFCSGEKRQKKSRRG